MSFFTPFNLIIKSETSTETSFFQDQRYPLQSHYKIRNFDRNLLSPRPKILGATSSPLDHTERRLLLLSVVPFSTSLPLKRRFRRRIRKWTPITKDSGLSWIFPFTLFYKISVVEDFNIFYKSLFKLFLVWRFNFFWYYKNFPYVLLNLFSLLYKENSISLNYNIFLLPCFS